MTRSGARGWGWRTAALMAAALTLAACGGGSKQAPTAPTHAPKPTGPPGEFGHNVVRVDGISPSDVAGAAILATFGKQRPNGFIFTDDRSWTSTVLAAQFAARPVYAGVV